MPKFAPLFHCSGCSACFAICKQKAIAMQPSVEGFLFPEIKQELCIECGQCEKVCPVLQPFEKREPLQVWAAKNRNEQQRLQSSSGGIFSLLAEQVIAQNGMVFGAAFNADLQLKHDYAETWDEVKPFLGSKYLQSDMGDCYSKAKAFLEEDRTVLFSGTPCQIAGLHKFLNKTYSNLITVDVICHGVPSPAVWESYIGELYEDRRYAQVNFRDKSTGWSLYSLCISEKGSEKRLLSETLRENIYMQGFLKDLFLRSSCAACTAKSFRSQSDITLGDFWGINKFHPEFNDDKGVSAVMVNSQKGIDFLKHINMETIPVSYQEVLLGNPSLETSITPHPKREIFFKSFIQQKKKTSELIVHCLKPSIIFRIKKKLARLLRSLCLLRNTTRVRLGT